MSIQDVTTVQSVTDYVINNMENESKQIANKVKSIFTENFYNGGSNTAGSISNEIERLESYISQKQEAYQTTYAYLKYTSEELNILNQQLQRQIYEVTQQADADERKQKRAIEQAIDETNQMYMEGDIEKSDMQPTLSRKLAQYCTRDNNLALMNSKLTPIKSQMTSMTNKIADLIDRVNCLESESKLAQGTLVLMKNLMSKMDLNSSDSLTSASQRPIYTPTKQALVDTLASGIKGLTKDGEYDAHSMSNPQMAKLKDFLGMNGDGKLGENGVLKGSMLNQMKDKGFTSKEALYAINWIFDKCRMSYQPGQQWSVPYGHGEEAKNVYSELIDQVKTLWGADALRGADDTATTTDPKTTTTTNPDTTTPTTIDNPDRTDPIGYSIQDTTYEFVIDRNKNNIFDNKSEFLGASNGINELKAHDLNNDGTVSRDEMESNEQLFVLMTNHETGEHAFKSIKEANIDSIDLNSLTSKNWTNINDNVLKNTFTVNTLTGSTVQGYQTNDSNFYIQKSYNGVENAEMAVTVDEKAMKQAENIFSNIKTLSSQEYGDISTRAVKSITKTQQDVNDTIGDMDNELNNAPNGLTGGERPKTAEEKREEEEKAAAEAAKKEEAAANKTNENEEKDKDKDKIDEE